MPGQSQSETREPCQWPAGCANRAVTQCSNCYRHFCFAHLRKPLLDYCLNCAKRVQ